MSHLIAFLFTTSIDFSNSLFTKLAKSCFKFRLLAVVSELVGEDLAMSFL